MMFNVEEYRYEARFPWITLTNISHATLHERILNYAGKCDEYKVRSIWAYIENLKVGLTIRGNKEVMWKITKIT